LGAVPWIARRLRELAPEVVHIHDAGSHAAAGIAARMAAKPRVVVTRRTVLPLRKGWISRLKYEQWCDRIVCVSEAVRERCLEGGVPEERLTVVPDFVDCRHFKPQGTGGRDDRDPPTVAVVGRLAPGKGHRVLLAAMKAVLCRMPDARLVVCGEGEEENALRRQVESDGLSGAVQFMGFVPDVRGVMSAADVVAMPSVAEGLGVAALEAMAMAKPVVSSDAGGLPESVVHGETGLVTPAGDPGALAEALLAVLSDLDLAERMGRAGRERALARFDRPRLVERMLSVYESVLTEDRA
jgi:glycosyltransferase involved in cell wall biosynthesis